MTTSIPMRTCSVVMHARLTGYSYWWSLKLAQIGKLETRRERNGRYLVILRDPILIEALERFEAERAA